MGTAEMAYTMLQDFYEQESNIKDVQVAAIDCVNAIIATHTDGVYVLPYRSKQFVTYWVHVRNQLETLAFLKHESLKIVKNK